MLAQAVESSDNIFYMLMSYGAPATILIALLTGLLVPKYRQVEENNKELAWEMDKMRDHLIDLSHNQLRSLPPAPPPNPYTEFDPDLYDIELIEPVLVADDIKWKKVTQ